MTISEWTAVAVFGLIVYLLSFLSIKASLSLLLVVIVAAFINRYDRRKTTGTGSTK